MEEEILNASNTEDDEIIWRYMDLSKFAAMLATRTLWFTKAKLYEDPFECSCEVRLREAPPGIEAARKIVELSGKTTMKVSQEAMFAHVSTIAAEYFEKAAEHVYVNSWCVSDESMAMWEIYGSGGRGIAVQSSVRRYLLAKKLSHNIRSDQFAFDRVRYYRRGEFMPDLVIDMRTGAIPMPGVGVWEKLFKLGFHKRVCFEHEREWRAALYQDSRPECRGCGISFNLDELIDSVYIGPRAESFLIDVVRDLMDKFELKKPVHGSELLSPIKKSAAAMGD